MIEIFVFIAFIIVAITGLVIMFTGWYYIQNTEIIYQQMLRNPLVRNRSIGRGRQLFALGIFILVGSLVMMNIYSFVLN